MAQKLKPRKVPTKNAKTVLSRNFYLGGEAQDWGGEKN